MSAHTRAPRNAHQAAADLLAAGHHVHYAAHAEQVCLTGTCRIVPAILDGIAPTKERQP